MWLDGFSRPICDELCDRETLDYALIVVAAINKLER